MALRLRSCLGLSAAADNVLGQFGMHSVQYSYHCALPVIEIFPTDPDHEYEAQKQSDAVAEETDRNEEPEEQDSRASGAMQVQLHNDQCGAGKTEKDATEHRAKEGNAQS